MVSQCVSYVLNNCLVLSCWTIVVPHCTLSISNLVFCRKYYWAKRSVATSSFILSCHKIKWLWNVKKPRVRSVLWHLNLLSEIKLLYYLITQELPVLIHADRQKRRLYLPKICRFFLTFQGVKLHLIYSLTKQTLKHRNKAFITSITSG